MSELLLAPGVYAPPTIQMFDKPPVDASDEEKSQLLPDPVGYKILCMVPDVSENFEDSAIIRAESSRKAEEHATAVLFVLKVGPEAYKNPEKFPSGAWCAPGDFVLTRTYTGTRFKVNGKEFRLLNDDQVEGKVLDPRGISRA